MNVESQPCVDIRRKRNGV